MGKTHLSAAIPAAQFIGGTTVRNLLSSVCLLALSANTVMAAPPAMPTANAPYKVLSLTNKKDDYRAYNISLKILGLAGNDHIALGSKSGIVFGGAGNDVLHDGTGNDYLAGGDGNDQISAFRGYNVLNGNAGDDVLGAGWPKGDFNDWYNIVNGGTGNDYMLLSGNGRMDGGPGNDYFDVRGIEQQFGSHEPAYVIVNGGPGADVVSVYGYDAFYGPRALLITYIEDFQSDDKFRITECLSDDSEGIDIGLTQADVWQALDVNHDGLLNQKDIDHGSFLPGFGLKITDKELIVSYYNGFRELIFAGVKSLAYRQMTDYYPY